jgi:SWI/SNF-related matrix-associated actin-dependent regulator 1 of chromatin subfamily A
MKFGSQSKRFFCECSYAEKDIPKGAGFRWEPVAKVWYTENPQFALKLSKYADESALAVLSDKVEAQKVAKESSRATTSNITIPAPEGLNYLEFQKAGINYCQDKKFSLIADEMGCVDGNAVVTVMRAGGSRKIKLSKVVEKFNSTKNVGKFWDKSIQTTIRCLYNGEFRSMPITWAGYKGQKQTLQITLVDGKSIKVTLDHEVLTNLGYVEAQNLSIGDTIIINGTDVCKRCNKPGDIITYKYAKFQGWCKQCAYRHGRVNHKLDGKFQDKDGYITVTEGVRYHPNWTTSGVLEHRLIIEAELNGLTYEKYTELLRNGDIANLKFLATDLQVHHKNEIPNDNSLENLQVVTDSEHKILHNVQTRIIKTLPKESKIVSIEDGGIIDVYDIKVPNADNFVANGIVVHNCGKTIQALGLINLKGYKKILIVCPASLKSNWKRECETWLVGGQSVGIVNGEFPETDVCIVNYDILKKWHNQIHAVTWDLLVCDEAHYLKNNKALRTQEVVGGKGIDKIKCNQAVFLTGTPILNRPEELWTTMKFFGVFQNWQHFVIRYCAGRQDGWGWKTDGSSNLGELNDILREKCMVRRLKADVLTELPDKQRRTITIKSDGKVKKVIAGQMEKAKKYGFELDTTTTTEMESMFESMAKDRKELGIAKLDFATNYINELLEGGLESIVVFAHHRAVLDGIQAFLDEKGIKSSRIDGRLKSELRDEEVQKFQNKETRVFLASIKAAGVGITLTRSSYVLFVEPSWTPADLKQAEDRTHRIGQTNAVQIDYLVFEGSLDEYILGLVLKKGMIEAEALDLDGTPVGEPLSLEEALAQQVAMDEEYQEKLEEKKSVEIKKNYIENFLLGKRVKAVVEVNGKLKQLTKLTEGWMIDGEFSTRPPQFDKIWHIGCCSVCGRKLSDSESILRGIGPICSGTK